MTARPRGPLLLMMIVSLYIQSQKMTYTVMVFVVSFILAIWPTSSTVVQRLRTGCYKNWRDCDWGTKLGPGDKIVGCMDLCRCWGYVSGRCVRLKYGRCPKDELNLRYYSCECQPPQGRKDSFWCRKGGF